MLIHFCSGSLRAEEGFLLGITPTTTSLKAVIDLLQSMFFLCSGTIKIISSVHLTLKEACTFPHTQRHLFCLRLRASEELLLSFPFEFSLICRSLMTEMQEIPTRKLQNLSLDYRWSTLLWIKLDLYLSRYAALCNPPPLYLPGQT